MAFGSWHMYFGNVRSCWSCAAAWTVVQEPKDDADEKEFDYDAHICRLLEGIVRRKSAQKVILRAFGRILLDGWKPLCGSSQNSVFY
jgi:hypothetical protein